MFPHIAKRPLTFNKCSSSLALSFWEEQEEEFSQAGNQAHFEALSLSNPQGFWGEEPKDR